MTFSQLFMPNKKNLPWFCQIISANITFLPGFDKKYVSSFVLTKSIIFSMTLSKTALFSCFAKLSMVLPNMTIIVLPYAIVFFIVLAKTTYFQWFCQILRFFKALSK